MGEQCAIKHRRILEAMPVPENCKVRCPKCRARLRVWPANHGPPFACNSSNCPVVGRLRSTGGNRFTCFPCNFDLCESCITRKLGRTLLNQAVELPSPTRSLLNQAEPFSQARGRTRSPARETSITFGRPNRDSWCFGPAGVSSISSGPMDPSAPLLPVHDEEPPPSYQEAIKDRV